MWIRIDLMRIRIQHFSNCGSGSSSESRVLITKNWKKPAVKLLYIFFGLKIASYLSLNLHKGRTSYRRRLQTSKENIQHFKRWNLLTFFLWVIFALLDPEPDPATQIYAYPCGCGSRSGSTTRVAPDSGWERPRGCRAQCWPAWGHRPRQTRWADTTGQMAGLNTVRINKRTVLASLGSPARADQMSRNDWSNGSSKHGKNK